MRKLLTAEAVSGILHDELQLALKSPRIVFGYGRYGDGKVWSGLDHMTGGLQPRTLSVLAARPKVGKSMLAAIWVPYIAEQAMMEDRVVRLVTLEMTAIANQRRMAAIAAQIPDPMNIRRGMLSLEEVRRYESALVWLSSLPIEYLSAGVDMSEKEALEVGNSPITFDEVNSFIRGQSIATKVSEYEGAETYWWLLDHIGLLNDLDTKGDIQANIYNLANKLAQLAHSCCAGMVITHLTRASVGFEPTIESIANSDQVGKNADQLFFLWRPFLAAKEAGKLSAEDASMVADSGVETAFLKFMSRDEGSGLVTLAWLQKYATFREMVVPPGQEVPLPLIKKRGGV
jgi:hypothetical protein